MGLALIFERDISAASKRGQWLRSPFPRYRPCRKDAHPLPRSQVLMESLSTAQKQLLTQLGHLVQLHAGHKDHL